MDALAAAAVKEFGAIDVWVNNAGKVAPPKELKDVTDKGTGRICWPLTWTAASMVARASANQMIKQGRGGRIVNVSSIHGTLSEPSYGPYTAAKGGMEAFTRTLATELARYKITCNTIAPGSHLYGTDGSDVYGVGQETHCLKDLAKEIAEADWIAVPLSSWLRRKPVTSRAHFCM